MKVLAAFVALSFSTAAFAQSAPPKAARPTAPPKVHSPMGCKPVGTVRGTKLWAGDCTDAASLRGAEPSGAAPSSPEPTGAAIPPGQKQ